MAILGSSVVDDRSLLVEEVRAVSNLRSLGLAVVFSRFSLMVAATTYGLNNLSPADMIS